MEPKQITAKAAQDAIVAGLRIVAVLLAGVTTLFGLLAKRDLSSLIAWVQSDGFIVFASAAITAGSFLWGVWKTYDRSHKLNTAKSALEGNIQPLEPPVSTLASKFDHMSPLVAIPVLLAIVALGGCTTAGTVRLNAGRAFYTAQIAFKTAQQSTLVVCTNPAPRLVAPCQEAVSILGTGAKVEATGFAAQQAGNATSLQAAVIALTDIPPRLAALGVLGN